MACCCVFCAGEGFCSNFLSIIISLTFSFHIFGILSPKWMCDGGKDCTLRGLYYTCSKSDCESDVPNGSILSLAVIVLISSVALSLVFCCILHCSNFRYKKMTPTLALIIGGWYVIQEIFTTAILIALAVKYDKIGWAAYVFTVPGIIFLGLVVFVLVYMWCFPSKTVHPV